MRRVRCVDCGLLERTPFIGAGGPIGAPQPVSLSDRKAFREEKFVLQPDAIRCHVSFADIQSETDSPRARDIDWHERPVHKNVVWERRCPHFIAFEPGYTPQQHLDLGQTSRNRRSDRRWDAVKIGIGFSAGVLTAFLGFVIKTWVDYFQALKSLPLP
jgi:hypothetical protein